MVKSFIKIDEIYDSYINLFILYDVLCGDYCTYEERKKVFDDFSNIFHINSKDEEQKLFETFSSQLIRGAHTKENYNILCRASNFKPNVLSPHEDMLKTKMKFALDLKEKCFKSTSPTTLNEQISKICDLAEKGNVNCLALMTYLQIEGVFVKKNKSAAIKGIDELRLWNDISGIMIGLSFIKNKKEKEKLLASLYASLSHNKKIDPEKFILNNYGIVFKEEMLLLPLAMEKAFTFEKEKRMEINYSTMKMLKSSAFDTENKKKILLNNFRREDFEQLPIDICKKSNIKIDALVVESELMDIGVNPKNIINNLMKIGDNAGHYKPLLIVCDDEEKLIKIENAIQKVFIDNPCRNIDFSNSYNNRFGFSIDNPIISALVKTKDVGTIIFMRNVDEIAMSSISEFTSFINKEYMENCKTIFTSINADLSGYLPILFSSTIPNSEIYKNCEMIEISMFE